MQKEAILEALYLDAWRPISSIASEIGISRQAIGKFIAQLERKGIIRYTIIENFMLEDNTRVFFVEIKTNPEEPQIAMKVRKIKGIRALDGIIGQSSLIARFVVRDAKYYNQVLEQLDSIVTGTRFQYYKVINCRRTFKVGGMVLPLEADESSRDLVLDALDHEILDGIQEIPVKPTIESLRVQLERSGVQVSYARLRRRLRRLMDAGIIHSFTTMVPEGFIEKTRASVKFYVHVLPKRLSDYNTLGEEIARDPRITELYRTGEEYGLLAIVRAENIRRFRDFLLSLYSSGKIQDTLSVLVLDENMPAVIPPIPDHGSRPRM